MTNYSRSVLKSNGLRHSKNLPVKFGFSSKTVPANIAKKLPPQVPSQTISYHDFQLLAQTPHACFHRQKWVHTRLSEKDRTQGHTRRNRGAFPPSSTVRLCAACEIPFIPPCFYIHTFPGSLWAPLSATVLSQTIFHRVFQLLSQMAHVCFRGRKRVTHSAFGERSHTTAHTAKQVVFWVGGGITTLGAFRTFRKPCVARG